MDLDIRNLPPITPKIDWEEWQPKGQTLIDISTEKRIEIENNIQAAIAAGEEVAINFEI